LSVIKKKKKIDLDPDWVWQSESGPTTTKRS